MKKKDKFQSSQDSIINTKNKKKLNQTFFAENKIVNQKNQSNFIQQFFEQKLNTARTQL